MNVLCSKDSGAWSRTAQVVKAVNSLDQAMYAEQVDGLAEGLLAAGMNKCCELEFQKWAETAREVTGALQSMDVKIVGELHGKFLEVFGLPSLNMLNLAPRFYKLAKKEAQSRGWRCQ